MKNGSNITEKAEEQHRTTISLPPEIAQAGRRRAQQLRRNFSNYIEALIAKDLESVPTEQLPLQLP